MRQSLPVSIPDFVRRRRVHGKKTGVAQPAGKFLRAPCQEDTIEATFAAPAMLDYFRSAWASPIPGSSTRRQPSMISSPAE
jgi:hypothetical protein